MRAQYAKFLRIHKLQESDASYGGKLFLEWIAAQTPETKPTTSPVDTIRKFSDRLTRLAPDWDRRRRLVNVRLKTIFQLYVAKWFYQGLEWNEIELLQILYSRFPQCDCQLLSNSKTLTRRGIDVVSELTFYDWNCSVYSKGMELVEQLGNLSDFLLSEVNYKAAWGLRSFQRLRDFLFTTITGHEHEGKTGIKKPRIRGYRDGKASPRDPKLTALARKCDQLFWEDRHEDKWKQLFDEIETMCKT